MNHLQQMLKGYVTLYKAQEKHSKGHWKVTSNKDNITDKGSFIIASAAATCKCQ